MGAAGTATIDFGAAPGTNFVSVNVTGQAAILSGSLCEAWMMADTTVSGATGHNEIEHSIVPIKLTCGAVTAGVGFTIFAYSEMRLTSTFTVHWVWN